MVDWNNVTGITFITLSFIAAFFVQEDLLISCGLAGIYCAIRGLNVRPQKIGEN